MPEFRQRCAKYSKSTLDPTLPVNRVAYSIAHADYPRRGLRITAQAAFVGTRPTEVKVKNERAYHQLLKIEQRSSPTA